jgi:hypothetical protein
MKNILTIFSGRKHCLEILIKYLKKALELKILDEIHFWNFTRNPNDEEYIKSISNLKRLNCVGNGKYIEIFTPLINNSFTLETSELNDFYIKIYDEKQNIEHEIILGDWITIFDKTDNSDNTDNTDDNKNIKVSIVENKLIVCINNKEIANYGIQENFIINNIYIKTACNKASTISYETIRNDSFYFMDTSNTGWKEYYEYYDNNMFIDDIIIKCDDDIVFIDLEKLPKFIEFIKNNGDHYDLIYANTINNNVSAYFQQNVYKLIPEDLMILEYPPGGHCGSLWESGKKAEILHNYFIENYQNFLNYDYNNAIIEINTRFSINFIGYKGNKWCKIKDTCLNNNDDEYNLTVDYVKNKGFKNILYTDFYVSHLSFFAQNNEMNIDDLVNKYHDLYDTIH